MLNHKLRRCLTGAVTAGVALTAALALGAGTAGAAPTDPAGGATPVYPQFYNGNVESVRDAGSDTTFFMMQQIGDVYTSAGLYGCTLNNSAGETLFNSADPVSTSTNYESFCAKNLNVATTDTVDNWNRTEVNQGVDNVGSSAGQAEVCNEADGSAVPATPLTVDFARSSKPSDNLSGCAEQQMGYAKDGVPVVDFPSIVPGDIGASTFSTYQNVNGGSGKVGPVAAGWLPGDPLDGPYSGTAFNDVDNTVSGVVSQSSVAYNLWCNTGTGKISDWGQLTNLGPSVVIDQVTASTGSSNISLPAGESFASSIGSGDTLSSSNVSGVSTLTVVSNNGATLTLSGHPGTSTTTGTITVNTGATANVGSGQAIGIPVRVVGLNTSSGTEATFQKFANSGPTSSGGCSANADPNAAVDPNPATATGDYAGNQYLLENNVANVGTYNAAYFTSGVTVDQADAAILDASSLYYMANGVLNTNPFASSIVVNGTSYAANKLTEDGIGVTAGTIFNNSFPTARTLFNIISQNTVRAPVAGFNNWLCDGNKAFTKGGDPSTGIAYDSALTNIVVNNFGFTRLTDFTSTTPASNPLDGQAAPNNTCDANVASVATTSGSATVTGTFPTGAISAGESIVGTGIPSGTTVVSNNSGTSLTLSHAATATGSVTVNFPGEPPVLTFVNP